MDDRNYYRMREQRELIELAQNSPTAELAVVLGELLEASDEEWQSRLDSVETEADNLQDEVRLLANDVSELEHQIEEKDVQLAEQSHEIAVMAAQIKQLKETFNGVSH